MPFGTLGQLAGLDMRGRGRRGQGEGFEFAPMRGGGGRMNPNRNMGFQAPMGGPYGQLPFPGGQLPPGPFMGDQTMNRRFMPPYEEDEMQDMRLNPRRSVAAARSRLEAGFAPGPMQGQQLPPWMRGGPRY